LAATIFGTIFRLLWAATAFCIAAGVALIVLYLLGAWWVGNELRAAAPNEPALHHGGAPFFGIVLFASTVTPALTALPAIGAALVGEILRIRSWIYYLLAGGASLAAIPLLVTPSSADLPRSRPANIWPFFSPRALPEASSIGCSQAAAPKAAPCHTACFCSLQPTFESEQSRIDAHEQTSSRRRAPRRMRKSGPSRFRQGTRQGRLQSLSCPSLGSAKPPFRPSR
jgi:hypothetical protein